MKYLITVCGPNGSGKSTFTRTVFARLDLPVLDPDRFSSQGISNIAAGKLAVRQINDYLRAGVSFIKESTLSSKFDIRTIFLAKNLGYKNILIYLLLPSPIVSLHRVERRVYNGGHNIPEKVILRRFERSLQNLEYLKDKVDKYFIIQSYRPDYPDLRTDAVSRFVRDMQKRLT